ncbi:hypothetical protein [Kitasatospora viridis]|uniref:Uncharacterized protein n=1 Tax=Kitasatospora viridis TaxID=281105 RepID=A0A561UC71_9ACTN|nr:hypothetical protein [Kitasatospora viridis]TWF96961.1 hypothetical protein FHX73_11735 [Kitasatospora viridis]
MRTIGTDKQQPPVARTVPHGQSGSVAHPSPLTARNILALQATAGNAVVVQLTRSSGPVTRSQAVLNEKTNELQRITEEFYAQKAANLAQLLDGAEEGIDTSQYDLWSGPAKPDMAPAYGGIGQTGESRAKAAEGFRMDQTAQHHKALAQLKAAGYDMSDFPRDPDYVAEFSAWLAANERAGIRYVPRKAQAKFLELKANSSGTGQAVLDPEDSTGAGPQHELVGYHRAQFGSAWEPTSDAVARSSTLAMIPVRSFGLDEPHATEPNRTAHPRPHETVQAQREIPMVIKHATDVANALRRNSALRTEIAGLVTDANTGEQLAELAAEVARGGGLFEEGARLLGLENEPRDRRRSAETMRHGRDIALTGMREFDRILHAAGYPAARGHA